MAVVTFLDEFVDNSKGWTSFNGGVFQIIDHPTYGNVLELTSGGAQVDLGFVAYPGPRLDGEAEILVSSSGTEVEFWGIDETGYGWGYRWNLSEMFQTEVNSFVGGGSGGASHCAGQAAEAWTESYYWYDDDGNISWAASYPEGSADCSSGHRNSIRTAPATSKCIITVTNGPVYVRRVEFNGNGEYPPAGPGAIEVHNGGSGKMGIAPDLATLEGKGLPLAVSSDSGLLIGTLGMPTNTRRGGGSMIVTSSSPPQVQWGLLGASESSGGGNGDEPFLSARGTTGSTVTGN